MSSTNHRSELTDPISNGLFHDVSLPDVVPPPSQDFEVVGVHRILREPGSYDLHVFLCRPEEVPGLMWSLSADLRPGPAEGGRLRSQPAVHLLRPDAALLQHIRVPDPR